MGSLRRGIALLAVLPGPAWAEVCDKVRPDWDGTQATALTEALALFSTLPSLALLVATAAALRFRSQWGGLAVVVGWALWTTAVAFTKGEIQTLAAVEGCMGAPTLFIAAVAAICAGTILYTLPRSTRL